MSKGFNEILNSVSQLLEKKRHDYGDNYERGRDKRGPVCFYLRIEDKLNRLEQLDTNLVQVRDESIEDTLNDIIGYCVLEINYRRSNTEKANPPRIKCGSGYCYNGLIDSEDKVGFCINKDFEVCKWRMAN